VLAGQGAIAGLFGDGFSFAALAVCVVLLYRTTGVLNFAICAIGTAGAEVLSVLAAHKVPVGFAVVIGVATGAGLSILTGVILTRLFFESSTLHRTTVAVAIFLSVLAATLWIFGTNPRAVPPIVKGKAFVWAGVSVSTNEVVAAAVSVVTLGSILLVLRHTSIGLRLRALSQRPTTSELLGLPVKTLLIGTWGVTGGLATLAGILLATDFSSDPTTLSLTVMSVLAGGLIGLYRSYVGAFLGGCGLGALAGVLNEYQHVSQYQDIVPFAAILGGLLWLNRSARWEVDGDAAIR
jgi:branched-chain amino acid transport system permease protein